jgi:hypothetical protein
MTHTNKTKKGLDIGIGPKNIYALILDTYLSEKNQCATLMTFWEKKCFTQKCEEISPFDGT